MLKGPLIITRPEHDFATRYLSRWSEHIIEEAKSKHAKVIDLHREKAARKRIVGILKKEKTALVVLNGHGDRDKVAGHQDEVILESTDDAAFQSKIIFARACRSAKTLAELAVKRGALAYLGYKEDFWLMCDQSKVSRPLEDKTAALFLEPSNHVPIALLKGHTAGDANNRSKNLFRKNIERLLLQGPSADNYGATRLLYWNMINQVCVGDENTSFN